MIKKYFLLLLAAILLTGVHGQNRQVDLSQNIPLQDILKKAKKQKKQDYWISALQDVLLAYLSKTKYSRSIVSLILSTNVS